MVVMLKQCCCGCSLKTGSLIIAVVFVIAGGLELLLFTNVTRATYRHLEYIESMESEVDEGSGIDTTEAASGNHTSSPYDDEAERIARRTLLTAIMYMSIAREVLSVFEVSVNIVLIFGANNDSLRLLLVWVILFPCTAVLSTLLYLTEFGIVAYFDLIIEAGIGVLILSIVFAATAIYSWLVVFSFYRHLRSTGVARRLSEQQDDH